MTQIKIKKPKHWDNKSWHKLSSPEQAMVIVKLKMHNFNIREMAEDLDLSTSALYAMRSGRTKWPRGANLFKVLRYLDLEMYFAEINSF